MPLLVMRGSMSESIPKEITAPTAKPISIDFFSKRGNKSTKLVNSSKSENSMDARHTWYEYRFENSVYLTSISIFVSEFKNWDKFDLIVDHIDGTKHEESITCKDNKVDLTLGKLVSGFRFRPPKKVLSNPKLIKVSAIGFTLDEFHEFEWRIKEFDESVSELNSREKRVRELELKVDDLEKQSVALASDVGKARSELSDLENKLDTSRTKFSDINSQIDDANSQLKSLRQERRSTEEGISKANRTLEELTRRVRLFPSEIAGFIKEGNRSTKWYIAISAPFVVILYIVLHSLFSSAIDLTQLWRLESNVDMWTVFLTRLPFVLVALALIEACSYIVGRLIFEIIRINRQRLEFAKLSIVAKDVSTASSSLTSLTDEEIFDKETALKMDLLREHMKNFQGSEFEYRGSAIINAISGVARRFGGNRE